MNKEKIKKFLLIFKDRFVGAEITSNSVLIAFYILLSIFPLVLVLGNVLPYLNIDPATAIEYMETVVPEAVQPILESVIQDLLTKSSGGLLTVGSIVLLWSASKGINYLQAAMNRVYGIAPSPGYILKRIISIITLLVIVVLLLAFVVVFGFGELVLGFLAPVVDWAQPLADAVGDLKWPVTAVFIFCMMVVVYFITPDTILRLRDAIPGALLTTAGLLLLTEAFALYLRFATRSFSSYGTLSAFFVLMFWLNFSAGVVIIGGVLNATIREYRCGKAEENKSDLALSLRNRLLDKVRGKWETRKQKHTDRKDTGGGKPQ